MPKFKMPPPIFSLGASLSPFSLSAVRCGRGLSLTVSGVVGISELSGEAVTLAAHGARLCITGSYLSVDIFEERRVEISGKVEDIRFLYGKN